MATLKETFLALSTFSFCSRYVKFVRSVIITVMKYKMTYNNKNMSGCSARGIALRDTKEELETLKETLKDVIENIVIEKNKAYKEKKD